MAKGDAESSEAKAQAPAAAAQARKYAPERIIAESRGFLDQPSYVVAGALADYEGDEITVEETMQRIEEFLNRPVGGDEGV